MPTGLWRAVGRRFALLLCCTLVLPAIAVPVTLAQPSGAPARNVPAGDTDPALYEGVRPELREEIAGATAGRLSRFRIDATLRGWGTDQGSIDGTLNLRVVNPSDQPLAELWLRLYANDPIYEEADLTLRDLTVDGAAVAPEPSDDPTLLRLPLATPMSVDGAVDLTMGFVATIPVTPVEGYGLFSIEPERGTWALAHWYPMLAGFDVDGWLLDPISQNGDPVFSNTALYDVSLTAPAEAVVVTSGATVAEETVDGQVRRRIVTGPSRDFAMVIDNDFLTAEREANGTIVTSYFDPAEADGGEIVAETAAQALTAFGERFGAYPYRELDLVQVRLSGAGGVEFPQLIYMGTALYTDRDRFQNPRYLEFVAAHEVAHQWWYGLVGNNQYDDAFIDEGLSEWMSSELFFGDTVSAEEGAYQLNLECTRWYFSHLFGAGDEVVDQPTDDFTPTAYGAIVYGKGCLAFAELRAEIGDEAFFAGLRDYATRYRFAIATPANLLTAFERAAGRDLGAFWASWFEGADGLTRYSEADYAALRAELGLP